MATVLPCAADVGTTTQGRWWKQMTISAKTKMRANVWRIAGMVMRMAQEISSIARHFHDSRGRLRQEGREGEKKTRKWLETPRRQPARPAHTIQYARNGRQAFRSPPISKPPKERDGAKRGNNKPPTSAHGRHVQLSCVPRWCQTGKRPGRFSIILSTPRRRVFWRESPSSSSPASSSCPKRPHQRSAVRLLI